MDNENVTNEDNRSSREGSPAYIGILDRKTEDHLLRTIERVSTVNPANERRLKE